MTCGFEFPHFLLAQTRRLMRIFGSIVQSFVLPMLHAWQDVAFRCSITLEFIGNDHSRHVAQPFEQLPKESLRSFFVPVALYQDIQHVTMLIDRSPQKVFLSSDPQNDLVQVPCVSTRRTTTTQFIGVRLPEFQAPLSHRFIGHHNASLGQKIFDITRNSVRSGNTARQRD